MRKYRHVSSPEGLWWAAFDDGTVWPVEIVDLNIFGATVKSTHPAAPQGEVGVHQSRVYDSRFNRPTNVR